MHLIMSFVVLEVSSWTEVIYMNIFLLVVKDSTRKQTQKHMKGSQVGMGSTGWPTGNWHL